jgi:hypothetical protein
MGILGEKPLGLEGEPKRKEKKRKKKKVLGTRLRRQFRPLGRSHPENTHCFFSPVVFPTGENLFLDLDIEKCSFYDFDDLIDRVTLFSRDKPVFEDETSCGATSMHPVSRVGKHIWHIISMDLQTFRWLRKICDNVGWNFFWPSVILRRPFLDQSSTEHHNQKRISRDSRRNPDIHFNTFAQGFGLTERTENTIANSDE